MAHQSLRSEQFINRNSFAQTLDNQTPRNDETQDADYELIKLELLQLPEYIFQLLDQIKEKPCYASTALLQDI